MAANGNNTEAAAPLVEAAATASPRFMSLGEGSEILQVALAPGDSIVAGERSFCYRGLGLKAAEVQNPNERGAIGRALGWTMKQDKVVKWTNEGTAPTYLGLSSPLPGKVIPVDLRQAGAILTKPQMFLCSVTDNQVTTQNLKLTPEGPFPVYHVDLRKVVGSGMCYIQAGGAAVQKTLGRGEAMMVEMGCVVAFAEKCKIVAEQRTGFIREPPYSQGFNVKITGPGTVFLQSSHVGRLCQSMAVERALVRPAMGDAWKGATLLVVIVAVLLVFFEV